MTVGRRPRIRPWRSGAAVRVRLDDDTSVLLAGSYRFSAIKCHEGTYLAYIARYAAVRPRADIRVRRGADRHK